MIRSLSVFSILSIFSKLRNPLAALALVLCLFAPLAAHAENKDMVQFGNDVVVHEGEEAHDIVCFFCSVQVDGTVHGDMVAIFGNVRVKGHAERDAVAILGNISLEDNASIERDVVVIAGNLHLGTGAAIGNDRVVIPLILVLLPFLVLAGIVMLIVWAIRAMVYRSRVAYPMPPPRY